MNKTLLFQVAFRTPWTQWIPDSAGIWQISFDQNYPGWDTDLTENMETEDYANVITVVYSGDTLTRVTSYTDTIDGRASALATEASFIFNTDRDTLYIRLEDYDDPRGYTINVGIAIIRLSDQAYDDTTNELLYRPDISNYPSLKEEKDPLFYKKISFNTFTLTLNNAGRIYDGVLDNRILGQTGQYSWGNEDEGFKQIMQANAEAYSYVDDNIPIKFVDERKSLSRSVPVNSVEVADYPDIQDKYIGAAKPLIYGYVNNHKCIPLDDDTVQSAYTILIADTEYHHIYNTGYKIYIDGADRTLYITNFSATDGTFKIANTYYEKGQEITFTGYGFVDDANDPIDNPLEIIKELFEKYLLKAYTGLTFNLTEYNNEISMALDIGISISEQTEVISIIEKICAETGIGFLIERDGLYTARSYDPEQLPILTIRENQWKATPRREVTKEQILSSVTVKYNQNLADNSWSKYTDKTNEDYVYAAYGVYKNKPYETLYPDAAAAQAFAESIMDRSKDERETFTGVVDDKYIDLSEVKIGKIAQIEVNLQTSAYEYTTLWGRMKCEILSVNPDLENRDCEIVFRKIESIDYFEYEFDFNNFVFGDDVYDFNDFTDGTVIDFNRGL